MSQRWKTGLHSASDVTHWKHLEDFGRFWKSQWVENWTPNETVDFCLFAETFVAGATRDGGGGRWKSQKRMIVPLSLCRRTFKLKGNKKVRTWTSHYVFFKFRDPMYICNERPMYITHIHIFMYMTMVHQLCVNSGCEQRTYQVWWSIGIDGERELKESMLLTCLDDDSICVGYIHACVVYMVYCTYLSLLYEK